MRTCLLLIASTCLFGIAVCPGQSASPSSGSAQDEAAIRSIIHDSAAGKANPHVSPTLDWENAFGIRYTDLAKRDAFYKDVVSPLQTEDTDNTLEVKLKFLNADVAVADEYWHIVGQLDLATHKIGPDRWGRTTYVFQKSAGSWTEVLERVADLRYAWYRHYDALPPSAPVPASTLASYAGRYRFTDSQQERTIGVQGDHLTFASATRTRVAIPVSASSFLLFDPSDLAEYARATFATDASGVVTIQLTDEAGDPVGTMTRLP